MKPAPPFSDTLTSNLQALQQFDRRHMLHDMVVDSIACLNKRVIISINNYWLILIGVVDWTHEMEESKAVWLYYSLKQGTNSATLHVDLECGTIDGEFQNLRLIRKDDFSVIIPQIDR